MKNRFNLEFCCENKMKGKYKIFNIIPAICFIVDYQFKEGIGDMKGGIAYSIFLDFLAWSFSVELNITNKD